MYANNSFGYYYSRWSNLTLKDDTLYEDVPDEYDDQASRLESNVPFASYQGA